MSSQFAMDKGFSLTKELVDDCVESLCQQGCRNVLGKIAVLERGDHIPETVKLGEAGRSTVLEELKSIMSVYGNVCNSS